MKILVSAYGCEPYKGSESGVGWNWVKRMSLKHELWVITRANNKEEIQKCSDAWVNRIHWEYYDLPESVRKLKKGDKGLYLYYYLWQRGIIPLAKELQEKVGFDCTWHLSFGSMWMPTFLYKLKVPFVWGPVGGGETVPKAYWPLLTRKNAIMQWLRTFMIRTAMLNPLFSRPARYASAIIVRTDESRRAFPPQMQEKIFTSLETCMEEETVERYRPHSIWPEKHGIRMIYTGRLIPLKAVEIPIRAIARMKHRDAVSFVVVGKGPLKKRLRDLTAELDIQDRIQFVDYMQRTELLDILQENDVYVFPSLKEGGSWALMEAMALGLPVICHDLSGMHIITASDCAFQIQASGIENSIQGFADAMDYFVENPDQIACMGRAAHERVQREFTWPSKDRVIADVLARIEEKRR